MLGPQDILDWRVEPEEALAAELRRHPKLRLLICNPDHPVTRRCREASPVLDRFLGQEPLTMELLRELGSIAERL